MQEVREPYEFYIVQCRTVQESKHNKPKKLFPCKKIAPWSSCGAGNFSEGIDPHHGTGNNWGPKWPAANREFYHTRQVTGSYHGWTTLKFAIRACMRCREEDAKGTFDYHGFGENYHKDHTAARHEFRLARVTVMLPIDPLSLDDKTMKGLL